MPETHEGRKEKRFSCRRLAIARQLRAITMKTLSGLIGVTAQAVSQYENGIALPSPESCRRIAEALNFDIGFFFGDDIEGIALEAISFRSRRAMTARVRDKTKSNCELASEFIWPALAQRFHLPQPDLPKFTDEEPELAANIVRTVWDLGRGPVSNMVHLLEAKGVQVYWFREESPYVDAVSFWRDQNPFVLVSQRRRGGERVRFDLAHELGHLVLHWQPSDLDSREVESQANRFAAAFLLPESQYRMECPIFPTLAQFLELKPRWKVSVQAMIRRSRDVGIISQWQYQSLFKQLSMKWGRLSELCELPLEESAVQAKVFGSLLAGGMYADDFAQTLRIGVDDLVNLIPAASHFRKQEGECQPYQRLTIEELGYRPPG